MIIWKVLCKRSGVDDWYADDTKSVNPDFNPSKSIFLPVLKITGCARLTMT